MFIKNMYHDWYMQLCNSRQQLDRVKSKKINTSKAVRILFT